MNTENKSPEKRKEKTKTPTPKVITQMLEEDNVQQEVNETHEYFFHLQAFREVKFVNADTVHKNIIDPSDSVVIRSHYAQTDRVQNLMKMYDHATIFVQEKIAPKIMTTHEVM